MSSTETVVTCYDMLDVAVAGKITDFTDGMYEGDESRSYLAAQERQAEWLLDQVRCVEGSTLLDIGCGYGRILKTAKERGARAVGITLSPQQKDRCVKQGLDVRVLNYKDLPSGWDNSVACVIANGSLEHFAQVQDAIDGRQGEVYREMFEILHRITKPGAYFASTAIHANRKINPLDMARGSRVFPRHSDEAHYARILWDNLGGWYPEEADLTLASYGLFKHVLREEATRDYHLTSEEWLAAIKREVWKPKVLAVIAGKILKAPRAAIGMLDTWMCAQSWMWQFREEEGRGTPTLLYRDVWERED